MRDRAPGDGARLADDPLARALASALAVVAALGVALELAHARSHAPLVEALVPLLSLSYEQNLPTWVASCLLFACGVTLAGAGRDAAARGASPWPWRVLACALLYASFDETAELHERLAGLGGGVVRYDWIVPAAAALVVAAAFYLPFHRRLPAATRRRFALAAAPYLGGAVAMELPLGWWVERAGDESLGYALIDAVEESLELAGAAVFLLAIRAHRRAHGAGAGSAAEAAP